MFGKMLDYRQIGDVAANVKSLNARRSVIEKRPTVPIAVIDDEDFPAENNLKNNGYNISILGDIKDISKILEYNIILCDLQGVGRHLNKKTQGAYIIDEIKRNHPEKFVVAYTGGSSDEQILRIAQNAADSFLKKDAPIEEWRDRLDAMINFLTNPVEVWSRQRYALIYADVPTLDILKLEDAFVRSLEQKDKSIYERMAAGASSSDLRAIAQSLAASGIFKILVG
jgi:DNA-binding NarL/FixJ family response regulator